MERNRKNDSFKTRDNPEPVLSGMLFFTNVVRQNDMGSVGAF